MITRHILPAAMLLFASACHSESSGPQNIEVPASMNFALPQLRQLSERQLQVPAQTVAPSALPEMFASTQFGGEALPSDYEEILARGWLIAHPSEAETRFLSDADVVYGQALGTSHGSFYQNDIHLRLFRDGSQISEQSQSETESCNCAHLRNPWGMTANTTIAVAGDCGLSSSAYAKHTARLDFTAPSGSVYTLLRASDSGSDHDSQPSCPAGNTGGGNGGGDDEEWYICYWEDYYDYQGRFTHRVNLGCEQLNVS